MENGSALRSKGPFPMTYDELEERFPQLIQDVPCFDFLICMKELPPGRPVAADQWVLGSKWRYHILNLHA